MPEILQQCGLFRWPLLLLAALNLILVIRAAVRLVSRPPDRPDPRLETGIHAILFWGALAAVMGFLGQYSGIYNASLAIARATEISPYVVAQGFAESFSASLIGLVILVASACAWFLLSSRYRQLAGMGGGAPTVSGVALGVLCVALVLTPVAGSLILSLVLFPVSG